jgi:hypothetical protein
MPAVYGPGVVVRARGGRRIERWVVVSADQLAGSGRGGRRIERWVVVSADQLESASFGASS